MTDRITRKVFLRRAAASGSILTVPGLLPPAAAEAAAPPPPAARPCTSSRRRSHFDNWTLYMDVNKKNHTFPSLVEFQKKYGVHVDYVEDINDNASYYSEQAPGPAEPRAVDRTRHRRAHGQRPLPRPDAREGLGGEARQERHSEHQEPRRRTEASELRSPPRLHAAVAVGV